MGQHVLYQFTRTRQILKGTLEGLSPELLDVIPEGFNNNIHWQVGHILKTAEFFLFTGVETLPENYQQLFGPGSKPTEWPADVPSVEALLEQLDDQLERIQQVDVETFNEKLANPMLGCETKGEFVAFGAFHESFHLGQIHILKRLVTSSK